MSSSRQIFFRTDDAWDIIPQWRGDPLPIIDVREEAKGLRFVTSANRIDHFATKYGARFRPFTLFGSGDFHHLTAIWTRQFHRPFTILSFDNHPDWDIRPPFWSCGAWVNRALEYPMVEGVAIWGCGNFECTFPSRLLGNLRAVKAGRLQVAPWAREKVVYPPYLRTITPRTWKEKFSIWVEKMRGHKIYVTIDLDCLVEGEVLTNWENGRFTSEDIVWALETLRETVEIIGGDICGGWSRPQYETRFQEFAGWFDHPKLPEPSRDDLLKRNRTTLEKLWPVLTKSP